MLFTTVKSTHSPTLSLRGGPGKEPLVKIASLERTFDGSVGPHVTSIRKGLHAEAVEQMEELEDVDECEDAAMLAGAASKAAKLPILIVRANIQPRVQEDKLKKAVRKQAKQCKQPLCCVRKWSSLGPECRVINESKRMYNSSNQTNDLCAAYEDGERVER